MKRLLFILCSISLLLQQGCEKGEGPVSSEGEGSRRRISASDRPDRMSDPSVVGFMAGLPKRGTAGEAVRPGEGGLPENEGTVVEPGNESLPESGEGRESEEEEEETSAMPEAFPPVSEADLRARFAVAEEMVRSGDPRAKEVLNDLLGHPDPKIQVPAVSWLGIWLEEDPGIGEQLEALQ